jgi:hypothetical protein
MAQQDLIPVATSIAAMDTAASRHSHLLYNILVVIEISSLKNCMPSTDLPWTDCVTSSLYITSLVVKALKV